MGLRKRENTKELEIPSKQNPLVYVFFLFLFISKNGQSSRKVGASHCSKSSNHSCLLETLKQGDQHEDKC